jgi:hypothetical protein
MGKFGLGGAAFMAVFACCVCAQALHWLAVTWIMIIIITRFYKKSIQEV